MIRKKGSKWQVISHRTGKLLGTYDSKRDAEAAIRRHARFRKKR